MPLVDDIIICLEGMSKAFRPGYPEIYYEESTPKHLSCISCVDDEICLANNWTYRACLLCPI